MADDESKGTGGLPTLDFGTYIAFFLPGVLVLYALTPLSPRLSKLFDQIVDKDTALGATFLLLAAGLVVGTVVSGLRAAFFDFLIVMRKSPKFNYENLKERSTLAAYNEAIANKYRFYQFYGNMFLALSLLLAVRYVFGSVDFRNEKPLFYLGIVVWFGLGVQSHKALKGTYRVVSQILGVELEGPKIITKKLPDGKLNQAYQCSLIAKDGKPPIKWSKTGGALPAGITVDVCGGLSGAPTASGDTTFTLQIEDATKALVSQEFSLKVAP